MKFSLFSDLHITPGVFMGGTEADLDLIYQRAAENACDFIIHAGDFCSGPAGVADLVEKYNRFPIPSYHILGNHDTDATPLAETLRYYRMPNDYYFFDCKGYRIIALNPNFFYDPETDSYVHYDMANYFAHGAYRDFLPPEQLEWLRETIASAPGPCILLSHESFERESNGVQNAEAVREIINAANRKRKHSVILCINGHYHRDFLRIWDDVAYLEINSASYDWVDQAHTLYPEELCRQFSLLKNTVVYNDPIHAIVTVEGTHIRIEGMESTMFMGITREMTGNPKYDRAGRPATPRVLSADFTLN